MPIETDVPQEEWNTKLTREEQDELGEKAVAMMNTGKHSQDYIDRIAHYIWELLSKKS